MTTIVVLVPRRDGLAPPPERRPLGRAALWLRSQGIDVVFGHVDAHGIPATMRPVTGGWERCEVRPDAIYDRWPSQGREQAWNAARACYQGLPWGNGPELVGLCRDKLQTAQVLSTAGVPTPAFVSGPADFVETLQQWHDGLAFIKPRFGSFGVGVRTVDAQTHIPATLEGLYGPEPTLMQRVVWPWQPEDTTQWISVRCLVQRSTTGWVAREPVARVATQPVVNVAKGASVSPASDLFGDPVALSIRRVAVAAAEAISAAAGDTRSDPGLELGVDLVVDTQLQPQVIEVNGRPRGHLAALAAQDAQRFGDAHRQAVAAPIHTLVQCALGENTF